MGIKKLEAKELLEVSSGTHVEGVCLIKDYSVCHTKTGSEFIKGTLTSGEATLSFKAWSNSNAFNKLKAEDYTLVPTFIVGNGDFYNGVTSVILQDVEAVEGFDSSDFLPSLYDIDAYWNGLKDMVYKALTEKGKTIANAILFENQRVADRFKVEFAAKSHHDNCKGGLLVHTYKVVMYTISFVSTYFKGYSSDFKDLLIIGALVHDIGKIDEMDFGVYTDSSIITHRILGLKYVEANAELIKTQYSEHWLQELEAIIVQHHDEFGDEARTIGAYIIFQADLLDSRLTLIQQSVAHATDNRIKIDDKYLEICK